MPEIPGLFDRAWYVASYPDVAKLQMDPEKHFEQYGRAMGRRGHPLKEGAMNHTPSDPNVSFPAAQDYAVRSLREYSGPKELPDDIRADRLPKVSFVMTTHNSSQTVRGAVQSLINQSWPNIEVVVCDDHSTDGTWEILSELKRVSPHCVRAIRLEANLGTYIAKNIAITKASGELILFQDSDDYSHPDRALVQVLPLIENPHLVGTRSRYCRYNPNTGQLIPVGEHLSKYGLITLAVRRKVFDDIGFFEGVKRAGDDEWFQRLLHFYGRSAVHGVDATLYIAELRQNSLAADLIQVQADGTLHQVVSDDRGQYVQMFQKRFTEPQCDKAWFRAHFPPVPKTTVNPYPITIGALKSRTIPVFASVCSIPAREEQLTNVVRAMLEQVDHLFVYLDKYNETPKILRKNPNVTVRHSGEYNQDFRDNAKFLAYDDLKKIHEEFYYFTCDDDLIYPQDYVLALLRRIDELDRHAVVGLHGVVCEETPTAYFRRRFIHHFIWATLKAPCLVNNLGTGTIGFHSGLFNSLDPRSWKHGGMVDILFSIEARRRGVPMVCCDRQAGWLTEAKMPEGNPTLYSEYSAVREKEKIIVEHLQANAPWGYKAIIEAVEKQPRALQKRLMPLLPMFAEELCVEKIFERQRG